MANYHAYSTCKETGKMHLCALVKAELLQLKLVHLFARAILLFNEKVGPEGAFIPFLSCLFQIVLYKSSSFTCAT